jgi:hypothetical protein
MERKLDITNKVNSEINTKVIQLVASNQRLEREVERLQQQLLEFQVSQQQTVQQPQQPQQEQQRTISYPTEIKGGKRLKKQLKDADFEDVLVRILDKDDVDNELKTVKDMAATIVNNMKRNNVAESEKNWSDLPSKMKQHAIDSLEDRMAAANIHIDYAHDQWIASNMVRLRWANRVSRKVSTSHEIRLKMVATYLHLLFSIDERNININININIISFCTASIRLYLNINGTSDRLIIYTTSVRIKIPIITLHIINIISSSSKPR